MPKFRKKPVIVEAEQFIPENPWPEGMKAFGGYPPCIETLEGMMIVNPGDWIITGVKGEKCPCKPNIFEMTYEPVENNKCGE